jgi:hypothetical protein
VKHPHPKPRPLTDTQGGKDVSGEYNIYVISCGRYNYLNFTPEELESFHFVVRTDEVELYRDAGCKKVFGTEGNPNLVNSRNFALDHAFEQGKICVQLDDDLDRVMCNRNHTGGGEAFNWKFVDALDRLVHSFIQLESFPENHPLNHPWGSCQKAKLMGVPPTTNAFYAPDLYSFNKFVPAACTITKPNPIRFDGKLSLKEDYDYTLQHIKEHGSVIRQARFLWYFKRYTNEGGAAGYRTSALEQANILYLMRKWNGALQPHRTRGADEISIARNPQRFFL